MVPPLLSWTSGEPMPNLLLVRDAQKLYSSDERDAARLHQINSLCPQHLYPPYSVVGIMGGPSSAPTTPVSTPRDQGHLDDIDENDAAAIGSCVKAVLV